MRLRATCFRSSPRLFPSSPATGAIAFECFAVAQIPYRAVEVNPLTKKELKWGAHRKVPVAMLDEEVLLDSSVIVSRLAAEAEAAKAQQAQQPTKGSWLGRKAAPASAPQPSAVSLGEPQAASQQQCLQSASQFGAISFCSSDGCKHSHESACATSGSLEELRITHVGPGREFPVMTHIHRSQHSPAGRGRGAVAAVGG